MERLEERRNHEERFRNVGLLKPVVNALIVVAQPIRDNVKKELIDEFDGGNIDCRHERKHWVRDWGEEDKPSFHLKQHPDGTIKLSGVDFTEGAIGTHLEISGNKRVIRVDVSWNVDKIMRILDKAKLTYIVDDDYEWPFQIVTSTIDYLNGKLKQL